MSVEIQVFVICVEAVIYFLLYNLHDCTFNIFFLIVSYIPSWFLPKLFLYFHWISCYLECWKYLVHRNKIIIIVIIIIIIII